MAILDSLIVAGCVGLSGQSNDACTKALDAGTKQSGIAQSANAYENHELKIFEQHAYSWFGKDAVGVVGGMVWMGKSVAEKKAHVGIYGPVSLDIGAGLTALVFKWTF